MPRADGDDTDDTPPDLSFRLPASPERKAFGTLELHLHQLAKDIGEIRRRWDSASPPERRALAAYVADEAREVGDSGHDLARLMAEIAAAA